MNVSTSAGTEEPSSADRQAIASLTEVHSTETPAPKTLFKKSPKLFPSCAPSIARQQASLNETPFDLSVPLHTALNEGPEKPKTIFYLAYGSNLAAETFLGKRGIRPLSQVNVVVPELVMTFDLAGIPYAEPCFANTAYRSLGSPKTSPRISSEKSSLLSSSRPPKYTNPHWPKGLVGVVYEVTTSDFAHIIATEGGGASYQDVLVDCHVLPPSTSQVPHQPPTTPFKAHTLFSPISAPDEPPPKDGGRFSRPDPEYAQASARYLKLITDGADEHGLPAEYKDYLHALQPYTVTSSKQRLGKFIFMSVWFPVVMGVFQLARLFQDKHGKSPGWVVKLTGAVFRGVWASYDGFFKGVFGDGERTVEKDEGESWERRPRKLVKKKLALNEKATTKLDANV